MKKYYRLSGLLLALLIALTGFYPSMDSSKTHFGGGEYVFEQTECINDLQRADIQREIDKNIADLKQRGVISDNPASIVQFQWPLRKTAGLTDPGYYGISNYVDQDNTTGLRDYNCGQRTYNGHKGLDVYTWPFGWYKMDNNQVEVIAGAPGTIIYKNDGQFDRSCAMNGNNWNAVYVRHADNSVAWYGHLKKNSLTTKSVGDAVVAGEYLGVLGSSGNSTGPHLHFEVYNGSGALVDPWQGTCNSLNSESWWAAQKPYTEPKVNAILTHKKPPVFPACPAQETLYVQNNFNPGNTIYFVFYYADQTANTQTQYSVIQPNGTVWTSWNHSSTTYYSSSYWWWQNTIPANAMHGTWTVRAVFNSTTYEKTFNVGTTGITPVNGEIPASYSLKQNYPNPFNPGTNFKFQIPNSGFVSLKVYDTQGKEVSTLVNEDLKAGVYEYSFDGTGLNSGVYFYRLQAGEYIETRRMVLVK